MPGPEARIGLRVAGARPADLASRPCGSCARRSTCSTRPRCPRLPHPHGSGRLLHGLPPGHCHISPPRSVRPAAFRSPARDRTTSAPTVVCTRPDSGSREPRPVFDRHRPSPLVEGAGAVPSYGRDVSLAPRAVRLPGRASAARLRPRSGDSHSPPSGATAMAGVQPVPAPRSAPSAGAEPDAPSIPSCAGAPSLDAAAGPGSAPTTVAATCAAPSPSAIASASAAEPCCSWMM